jgi:hypothetical protein
MHNAFRLSLFLYSARLSSLTIEPQNFRNFKRKVIKNENKFPVEWSDLAMPSWVSATVKAVSSLALLLMSRIWSTSNNPDIGSILKTLGFGIKNKGNTISFEKSTYRTVTKILVLKNEIIRITLKVVKKI